MIRSFKLQRQCTIFEIHIPLKCSVGAAKSQRSFFATRAPSAPQGRLTVPAKAPLFWGRPRRTAANFDSSRDAWFWLRSAWSQVSILGQDGLYHTPACPRPMGRCRTVITTFLSFAVCTTWLCSARKVSVTVVCVASFGALLPAAPNVRYQVRMSFKVRCIESQAYTEQRVSCCCCLLRLAGECMHKNIQQKRFAECFISRYLLSLHL